MIRWQWTIYTYLGVIFALAKFVQLLSYTWAVATYIALININ